VFLLLAGSDETRVNLHKGPGGGKPILTGSGASNYTFGREWQKYP